MQIEVMDDRDRQTLNDNLIRLSENCNFDNLLGYLKMRNVFTSKQMENYESDNFRVKTEPLKCQELFKDIQTRGPQAYGILSKCMKDIGQYELYRILTRRKEVEKDKMCQLKVKKSTSFPPILDVFKMRSSPRGLYLFINNIKFDRRDTRDGAEADQSFTEILEEMGYTGTYVINKTTEEMRKLLKNFATNEALANVDSLIVAISSHGNLTPNREWMIYGTDDVKESNPLLCDEIISLFNTEQCKLPKNQPKIFFFQACRGDMDIHSGKLSNVITVPVQQKTSWVDTFLLAPSFEGLKANRNTFYGSWLFMAFTEVFQEHAHNTDLESMKKFVNAKFDDYYETYKRQQTLSYYTFGVSKRLYFNPGLYDNEG